jgi:type II secretory pathway pseudopilin PulG
MLCSQRLRVETGMTLVEVMVAIVILLVGVLGTVTMIDAANAGTSKTKAREGATHLGRQILEIARSVPYRDLTSAAVEAALTSRTGLADSQPGSPGYQIVSRKFTYDVTVGACSLDDPKDRLGVHDPTTTFCSDTDVLPPNPPPDQAKDRNPDDFRRVAVRLSWKARPGAATDTTRQTTILTNPVGGLGPSVTLLEPDSLLSNPLTGAEVLLANFDIETDLPAQSVLWSIDGATQGSATGSNKDWTFDWPLVKADGSPAFFDGTYLVRAEAFDAEGRSGTPKSYTMVVNRIPPLAPTQVEGGRNLNGNRVDLEWQASRERDVVGYRVYRSQTLGVLGDRVVCFDTKSTDAYTRKTSCLDESAPAPVLDLLGLAVPTLYYTVVAVDQTSAGDLREGLPTTIGPLAEGNTAPTKPTGLTACTGGAPGCNDADGQPAPTGTTVLAWNASTDAHGIKFYRVYRGPANQSHTYERRYDRLYPSAGKPLIFIDSRSENGPYEYRISAVDERFGESALSDPVTR